jgi:hypothetical protein
MGNETIPAGWTDEYIRRLQQEDEYGPDLLSKHPPQPGQTQEPQPTEGEQ